MRYAARQRGTSHNDIERKKDAQQARRCHQWRSHGEKWCAHAREHQTNA